MESMAGRGGGRAGGRPGAGGGGGGGDGRVVCGTARGGLVLCDGILALHCIQNQGARPRQV
jgi:hypothetical protein